MAKITREQVVKWSEPCKNGFVFDVYSYLVNGGGYHLTKNVFLNEEHTIKLECSIYYREHYDWKTDKKNFTIIAHVDRMVLNEAKTFWRGGLGIFIEHPYEGKQKSLKNLYPMTEIYTDDVIKRAWTDKGYSL